MECVCAWRLDTHTQDTRWRARPEFIFIVLVRGSAAQGWTVGELSAREVGVLDYISSFQTELIWSTYKLNSKLIWVHRN